MEPRNELIYSSKQCILEPLVYERPIDSATDKLITRLFISKVDRVIKKGNKFFYTPSEEYIQHVAKVKKYKYLSA